MKIIFCTLCVSLSLVAQAQEKVETLSKQDKQEMNVSISVDDLSRLENEKKIAVQECKDLKQAYLLLQKQDSVKTKNLNKLTSDYNSLKRDYESIVKSQELVNKELINIASNFLYIPYEAYSIQEVAIPAFKAVTDQQLLQTYHIRLILLENYQQDIRDVLAFISEIEKELIPFTQEQYMKSMHQRFLNMNFYRRYCQYDGWKNTYLGKKLKHIDTKMKSFNGKNKLDFTSIKRELNQCLESIKDYEK